MVTVVALLAASHFFVSYAFIPHTLRMDYMSKNVNKTPKFVPSDSFLHNVQPKSIVPVRQSVLAVSLHAHVGDDETGNDKIEGEEDDKKVTFRQKLKKMGTQVVLSYGFVSNMSYAIILSLAWYTHSVRTGLSPLAAGQKKGFLAVYSGLYLFNNIIRPARFTLSVVISKYFDRAVKSIEEKFKISKGKATFILVLIANVFGTCSAMALGVLIASAASGVPIWRTH